MRCIVLFWLFFVLVLVLVLVLSEAVLVLVLSEAVLVLDRSCNCIIPSCSTRCSGGNSAMDRLMEIRSMIRESGNGG